MNKAINISALGYILWIVVYSLFGQFTIAWNSIFYLIETLFVIFILFEIKKLNVKQWIINLVISYLIVRVLFNLGSLISIDLGRFVNRSFYIAVFIVLTIFIWTIINRKYDEKQSVIQKIQELDKTKLSIPEFKEQKNDLIEYIDKSDDKMRNEMNDKLTIIIQNQEQTNDLLKELSKK